MPGVRASSRRKAAEAKEAPPTKKEKVVKAKDEEAEKEEKEAAKAEEESEEVESKESPADSGVESEGAAAAKGKGRAPVKIIVEHCKSWRVYNRNAVQLTDGIRAEFPDVEVELNPIKPRSKSFEITVTFSDKKSECVWSGIKKGPPRKLKFPEVDDILKEIKKNM